MACGTMYYNNQTSTRFCGFLLRRLLFMKAPIEAELPESSITKQSVVIRNNEQELPWI